VSEIIQLTDKLRIRRLDRMNVVVEKLVHDKKNDVDNWRQASGNGFGPFLQSEADACVWVLKHGLVDEGGETDLREAIKRYEAAAKKLARAVSDSIEKA
jgi:hypothetical protein